MDNRNFVTENRDFTPTNGDIKPSREPSDIDVDLIEEKTCEDRIIEGKPKTLPFPKSIAFIISNEFCERFMFYGIKTILVLYLTRILFYDDDTATIIFHMFNTLAYFMCILGAILSDSWLGKFKTILYLSAVYAVGSIIVALGAVPWLYLPGREVTLIGLALVAFGSGGIKPCVAAFGGDQFKLPEQAVQMTKFFSIFYFAINCGSLISSTVTPILRHDVSCFGETDCFSLAFGVPGILMLLSIVIFISGKSLYEIKGASGNMFVLVFKCITNAISTRIKHRNIGPKKNHWLDYAEERHGKNLVNDTKAVLKVLVLYIPLPLFWALCDQQGSRWTFQATRMDGNLGFFELKPDQMFAFSSFLVLVFIPLNEVLLYPILAKIGIRRPLQKLTLGGLLAGASFILSGLVEWELEKSYPILPTITESQLRIFNTMPCDYSVQTNIPNFENFHLNSMQAFEEKHIYVNESMNDFQYDFMPIVNETNSRSECNSFTGYFNLTPATAVSYFLHSDGEMQEYMDDPNKSRTGDPVIRILTNINDGAIEDLFVIDSKSLINRFTGNTTHTDLINLIASTYTIMINDIKITDIQMAQGRVCTIMIRKVKENVYEHNVIEITAANSMSMLWMIPQYIVMALGEVTFSVTGLQFSYSQAPDSMKSVLQAFWQLNVAFGNVIDIIIVGANIFNSQAAEFFLFAGVMFVDMCIFIVLAWRYKSI